MTMRVAHELPQRERHEKIPPASSRLGIADDFAPEWCGVSSHDAGLS